MSSETHTPELRQRANASSSTKAPVHERIMPSYDKGLIERHSNIAPLVETTVASSSGPHSGSSSNALALPTPSIATRLMAMLLKPLYFLPFAFFHVGLELTISARTMKTYFQVFFLPHQFPVAPELVRVLRGDLGMDLSKKPKHLAVIMPQDSRSSSEEQEEEWHAKVAQLAQWSVASGIQCLSIMRTDPLPPQWVDLLQEKINDGLTEFYQEEKVVPTARVRTLRSVEDTLKAALEQKNLGAEETEVQRRARLHGGKPFDLDVVILAERDGHDRIAANVRALGEAALHRDIHSKDITIDFLDKQLSMDLLEPELLIVLDDNLDLSSYPPWHIRLTEIYHHPDQAIIPIYTMFLQALHRYAKCEQRFGK